MSNMSNDSCTSKITHFIMSKTIYSVRGGGGVKQDGENQIKTDKEDNISFLVTSV